MKLLTSSILAICLATGAGWSRDKRDKANRYHSYKKPTQEQIDAVTAKIAEIEATMQKDISPQKKQRLNEIYQRLTKHHKRLLNEKVQHEQEAYNRFGNFLDNQKLTNEQKSNIKNAYKKMRDRRASRIKQYKARVKKRRENIGK